jgi:hypothetical protein
MIHYNIFQLMKEREKSVLKEEDYIRFENAYNIFYSNIKEERLYTLFPTIYIIERNKITFYKGIISRKIFFF